MFLFTMRKTKGLVRTIVTRTAVQTGEVQVTLITTKEELPNKEQFIAEVQNRCQRLNQLCKM